MSMAMKMVRRRGAATVWRRACVRASRRIVSCGRVGVARFEYDAIGRIVSRGHALGTNTFDRAYTYDDFDRLAADGDVTYAYDAAGNRLSKTDAGGPVAYTLGMGDRLASWTGGSYSHDTAGCVTRIVRGGDALNLSWNGQYQLVSVATNGAFAESYAYDALGRRVSTTTLEGTIRHVYDGVQCIADLNADGEVVVSYTWGAGIDNLLAIHTGGATYYPLTDVQGTIWGYVDANNTIVARFVYDACGNILSSTSFVLALATNRYRFQCREWSAATGLVNFRARWYDPVTGRWLSKDPIGLSGGLNLYVFCGDDPVNTLDPIGTAHIEYRPLDAGDDKEGQKRNNKLSKWNLPGDIDLRHVEIFFDDDNTHIGYGPTGIHSDESTVPYTFSANEKYDDKTMREAVENLKRSGKWTPKGSKKGGYNFVLHNCQDFLYHAKKEYNRLKPQK